MRQVKWLRILNYVRWRLSRTPVLLNTRTWELLRFTTTTSAAPGEWLLRRPLTLPESTNALFLSAPVHLK
jgi:hypothetical protein